MLTFYLQFIKDLLVSPLIEPVSFKEGIDILLKDSLIRKRQIKSALEVISHQLEVVSIVIIPFYAASLFQTSTAWPYRDSPSHSLRSENEYK